MDNILTTPVSTATDQIGVVNVLGNDTLNGLPINPADVTVMLAPGATLPPGFTLNPDGTVDVAAGTPSGSYSFDYEICEAGVTPPNCSIATVTVPVVGAIAALPESYPPVSGADGGTLPSILGSDTLNGAPVNPAEIDVTIDAILGPDGLPSTAITVNPDGTIDVPPGTPAGDYTVEYTICDKLDPTNCSTTVETITVAPPGIAAIPETYPPVNGATGGSLPSILGSDTLNGAIVDPADIDLTVDAILGPDGTPSTALTVNPDGTIDVAPGTPTGDYTVEYTICEITNPTNCSSVSETITVLPASPQLGVTKSATNIGSLNSDGTFEVTYTILVENTGDVVLTPLTLIDDLSDAAQLGSAFNGVTVAPVVSLTSNNSGNAIAPTSTGAAFTGDNSDPALIIGTDGSLDPTDAFSVTFTISIDPNAAGAPANLANVATAGGTPPDGPPVTDDSNSGTDPDGSPTGELPGANPGGPGDPTLVTPPAGIGQIGATKGVIAIGDLQADGSFDVTYQIVVRNTGTAPLTSLRLNDLLEDPANLGTAFISVTAPPVVSLTSNASGNAVAPISTGAGFTGRAGGSDLLTGTTSRIDPNDEFAVEFTANLNANAPGAPTDLNNQATVSGTVLGTTTVVSDSTNANTDIDGDTTGEMPTTNPGGPGLPTPVAPPTADARIGVAKSVTVGGALADGTFDATFTLLVENLGNVQLSQLTLEDELSAPSNLGTAFVALRSAPTLRLINTSGNSTAPSLNSNFTGNTGNAAILTGTDGVLQPGDQYEVVFVATIDPNAANAPAELTNQAKAGGTSPDGMTPEDLSDDGSQASGPNLGGDDNDPTPIAVPESALLMVNKSTSTPSVTAGGFASYTVTITNPAATPVSSVTLVDDLPGGFAYVVDSAQLLRGSASTPATVSGIDPITTIIGSLDAGETVNLSYLTRVGAGVVTGEHVNSATAQVFGQDASNTAQATVALAEDPLLTTTRVIGKVWHDRDGDGWQDAAHATGITLSGGPFAGGKRLENLAARASDSDIDSSPMQRVMVPSDWRDLDIVELRTAQGTVLRINNQGAVTEHHRGQKKRNRTAQNISVNLVNGSSRRIGASGSSFLEIRNEGVSEEGLPGVRLATIEGLLIETDRWGRYHIEEIENVSWDIGSNYIVKVDPQTLPQGAEFTTENPRVERLTQSLMSDIDFGVRIPQGTWQELACTTPAQALAAAPAPRVQPQGGVTIRTEPLTTIRFDSGDSTVDESEMQTIKNGLERWRGQQNLRLRFTGHTDSDPLGATNRARYGDNRGLSEARAERVAKQVIETLGLSEQEVVLAGFGDAMPMADNASEAGKALNRRVTVEATFEIPNSLPEPVTPVQPAAAAVAVNEHCGPQTAAAPQSDVVWQEEEITETLADKVSEIRFASGKSDISDEALSNLQRRIDELGDKQNLRLRFIGHTDNEALSDRTASIYGSNQGLSEARAQQVAERVQQSLQISSSMIEIEGRGDTQPLADNSVAEGMALNRRVEIVLVYDETRTVSSKSVVERAVTVDQFSATSKPTHGVVRAIEDRAQLDPRLAVVAQSDYLAPTTQAVRFYRYSNYPAFVDRFEVNIYRVTDIDRIAPIATLTQSPSSNLDVEGEMIWNPESLRAGDEYVYVLSALDKTGARDTTHPRTLSVLRADKVDQSADSLVEPHSIYGESSLAQQSIALTGGRIRVWGRDLAPSHTLTVADEPMALDERGNFVLEAHLPQGRYTLPVVNKNPAGPGMQQDLNVEISDSYLFMVGLANVTFGGNSLDSVLEPLAADDRFDGSTYTSGQIGFYLKGKVRGKYLITAQLDSTEDELSNLGDNLRRQDPRSVFRRLEADQYYPVYGDDSTTRRDTESQGAGYVRVDWNKSKALWGNFETGITGNEFAQYNRSLYGAQLVYRTNAVTENGENRVSLTGFASEANSVAAHNEFAATGGSLYYLRDTDIVRGSEKLWVEVRRRDTFVVIEQIALQPGVDYEFDHIQGRVLLNRPLSQVTRNRNAAIIRSQSIEGDRVFLVANYEYVPSGFDSDDLTAGARGHVWVNSALGLGGTYINESRSGSDYTLAGGDVTLRHGKGTYLKLEGATSESSQTVSQFSNDGGLTFGSAQGLAGGATEGDAYGAEARLNLRDISNRDGVIKAWYKNREEGFSSSRETIQTTDTTDIGFEADVQVSKRVKVIARGNELERDGQSRDQVISVQGEARLNSRLDAAIEVRDEQRDIEVPGVGGTTTVNSDATLFGARINFALDPNSSIYVEGQMSTGESAAFEENDRIAIGAKTRLSDTWGVGIEVSEGDRGSAVLGSVDYRVSDDLALDIGAGFGDGAYGTAGATINLDNGYQLYGSYGIDPDSTLDRQRNVTTLGQRLVLGNGAKIFNEHQWTKSDSEDGVTNVFGIEYALNDYSSVSATIQRGELEFAGVETNRDAASIGFSVQRDTLRLGSRIEWRRDENAVNEFEQWLTSNALEWKQSESTRWLAKLNFSQTEDNLTGDDAARLAEASVGFAYRPTWTDRWNVLGRYTYLDDLVAPGQVLNRPDQRSHVAAIETLYDLNHRWEFGLKLAIRRGQIRQNRDSGPWFDSGLDIAVGRVRYHVTHKWDGLLEYRYVANSELNDERSGALLGVYRHIGKRLKFGAGYNFTDYSDDLTNLDYDNGGWFVDLIGKF